MVLSSTSVHRSKMRFEFWRSVSRVRADPCRFSKLSVVACVRRSALEFCVHKFADFRVVFLTFVDRYLFLYDLLSITG